MPGPNANPTACAVVRKPIQRPLFRKRDRIAHHRHRGRYQARKQHALNKADGNEQQRHIDERQQQVGDDKTGQRDEEDGFATNTARPGSHWRAKEEHSQTKGSFHQRQHLRSQPQSLQALREDGNDHGKAGHHQSNAADQERQSGGDRSRFCNRGSCNRSCSHHILQRALTVSCSRSLVAICFILSDLGEGSDNTLVRIVLSHPRRWLCSFLLAYITCNLQVSSTIYLLPDLPKTGNHKKSEQKNSKVHDENPAVLR